MEFMLGTQFAAHRNRLGTAQSAWPPRFIPAHSSQHKLKLKPKLKPKSKLNLKLNPKPKPHCLLQVKAQALAHLASAHLALPLGSTHLAQLSWPGELDFDNSTSTYLFMLTWSIRIGSLGSAHSPRLSFARPTRLTNGLRHVAHHPWPLPVSLSQSDFDNGLSEGPLAPTRFPGSLIADLSPSVTDRSSQLGAHH